MTTLLQNRYQIIEKLGSGGFGETFIAEDLSIPSHRKCVVKRLKPISDDPRTYQLIQERFQKEAITLEKLGQENSQIPTLYAYLRENDQFYLVQEYIEGVTLINKIETERMLNENTVKNLLVNTLSVLEFVHSQGIVHRDIKPDNIILRSSDHLPVLIDFGAVKETMRTVVNSSNYGNSSIVIGTPGFMSSEQSCGRPTFSSDLYSLGLTAIYLLTGKFPQEFNTDPQTGEILWQYDVPSLSPSFVGILHKAIQTHYRDRYQSAREMRLALEKGTNPIIVNTNPIITTPQITENSQNTYQNTNTSLSLKDREKSALMASIIGGFMLVGIVLSAFLLKSQLQSSPVSTTSSSTTPTTENSSPTVNPTPQNSSPTVNSTSQNSPTTVNPTPQNTDNRELLVIQNTPPINKPSPEETVLAYYSAINSGNYRQAWNMLPASLQNNTKIHPNGYYSFESWFQKITPINIIDSKVIAESSDTAKVNLHYSSFLNGKPLSMILRYQLVWSESQQQWLIQSVTKVN